MTTLGESPTDIQIGITAGILFDIALGSFMQWETDTGKLFGGFPFTICK